MVALHGFHKEVMYDPSSHVSKRAGRYNLPECLAREGEEIHRVEAPTPEAKDELSMLHTTKSTEASKNPTVVAVDPSYPYSFPGRRRLCMAGPPVFAKISSEPILSPGSCCEQHSEVAIVNLSK